MRQNLMETTYGGYVFNAKPGYLYHQHECLRNIEEYFPVMEEKIRREPGK